jgi:predicted Zn-dependent protease
MKRFALIVLLVTFSAAPAFAEVKTHPTAKVSMDVPDGWKMGGKGDTVTVTEPKGELAFILMVSEAADFQKSVTALDAQVAKVASDIKWAQKEPTPTKLNGMDGIMNKGSAKVQGTPADLGLLVLKTPSGKALLVLAVVDSSKKEAHKDEAKAFVESIKPAP